MDERLRFVALLQNDRPNIRKSDGHPGWRPIAALPGHKRHENQEVRNDGQGWVRPGSFTTKLNVSSSGRTPIRQRTGRAGASRQTADTRIFSPQVGWHRGSPGSKGVESR
jgi:hypothetical protein